VSGVPQRRLFFALVPGSGARTALDVLARRHAPVWARRVPAADLHLTLLFLGNVPESGLPPLRAAAGAIVAPPFSVVLDRLERWRGGLLCATGTAGPAVLALHQQLLGGAREAGCSVDARPFRAHATLARGLPRTGGAADEPIAPVRLQARSFCLMESRERPDGRRYSILARWRLDKARYAAAQQKMRLKLA
jgi:2'-5' RNA ligase